MPASTLECLESWIPRIPLLLTCAHLGAGSRDWGKLTLRDKWEVPIPDWGPKRELEDILRGEIKEDHLLEGEEGNESVEREGNVAVEKCGVVVLEIEVLLEDVGPEFDIERSSEVTEVASKWSEEVMEEKGAKLSEVNVEKDGGERAEERRGEDVMEKECGPLEGEAKVEKVGGPEKGGGRLVGVLGVKGNVEVLSTSTMAESLGPLAPSWGTDLPAPASSAGAPPLFPWRPWDMKVAAGNVICGGNARLKSPTSSGSGNRKKRRGAAAAARSQLRLLKWHEKQEPLLGPSRLQLQLQNSTPYRTGMRARGSNLASRFDEPQAELCLLGARAREGGEPPGAQAHIHQGGERSWSETPGNVVEILSASGHQTFSSLRQMISTSGARVDFPTPPPTPGLQSGWTGDWWMVPRGIMTRCSSCSVWGPLTP